MARAKHGNTIEWPFPSKYSIKNTWGGYCPICRKDVWSLYHYDGFPAMCASCYDYMRAYSNMFWLRPDPYNYKKMYADTQFTVDDVITMINFVIRRENEEARSQAVAQNVSRQGQSSHVPDMKALEEKELALYKKALPYVDEKDFDFELCDRKAFEDYLNRLELSVKPEYIKYKIGWFEAYFKKHPLVDVELQLTKCGENGLAVKLVHRAESVEAAHEKFRRMILTYRKDFPYLSDVSGMVIDESKFVVVVIRNYLIES